MTQTTALSVPLPIEVVNTSNWVESRNTSFELGLNERNAQCVKIRSSKFGVMQSKAEQLRIPNSKPNAIPPGLAAAVQFSYTQRDMTCHADRTKSEIHLEINVIYQTSKLLYRDRHDCGMRHAHP